MPLKLFSTVAAATALVATPIAAAAAPPSPVAAAPARAGSPVADGSDLSGGLFGGGAAIYAILIVVGIAAIIAVGTSNDDNGSTPRSP